MASELFYVDSETARRRTAFRRDAAAEILRWASHLPRQERVLLEAVYRDGRPVAEIAALAGERPRNLQRRVRDLERRVRDPLFRFVAARGEYVLPPDAQAVARQRIIENRPLRDIARATRLSLYRVRRILYETESVAGVLTSRPS